MKKIVPFLWFEKNAKKIAEYYTNIFGTDNVKVFDGKSLSDTPSGNVEIFSIQIFDQLFNIMTAGKHHEFNDAISFVVNCKDQDEIDNYWNKITEEGNESMCGWCIDKYGLRWQIIPENMSSLVSKDGGTQKMLKMKKIIISEF